MKGYHVTPAWKPWWVSICTVIVGSLIVFFLFRYNMQGFCIWSTGKYRSSYSWEEYLLVNTTCLLFLPVLTIHLIYREDLGRYGLKPSENNASIFALCFFLFMLPFIFFASRFPVFRSYYPIQKEAIYSFPYFLYFEVTYGFYLLCWEFFFRGFLTFGLERKFGAYAAIVLQAAAFCLMHWTKPMPEVIGSFAAGIALGWLALRGRSIMPGFLIHWCISILFDILAIHGNQGAIF
jgi:membrane protease YdiL (CAAX protease family)